MKEEVVVFGEHATLVGVVTQPDDGCSAIDRPPVLLLSSGLLHRIGPHRLTVNLARTLAARGFTCLRFDFSGLGDSSPREDGLPARPAAVAETTEAMDYLASKTGSTRFVLVGLCSGADCAFRVLHRDERAMGAVLMDPFAYQLDPEGGYRPLPGDRDIPLLEETRATLGLLGRRGVRLLLLYSAEYTCYVTPIVELYPWLREAPWLTFQRLEHTDHTFTIRAHRRRVIETISNWITGQCGLEPLARRATHSVRSVRAQL